MENINLFTIMSFLVVLSTVSMSVLLFLKGRDVKANIIWGILCLTCALFGFGLMKISLTIDIEKALFWKRIANFGVIFSPVFYLHFVSSYFSWEKLSQKLLLFFVYFLGVLFLMLNFFYPKHVFLGDMRMLKYGFYYSDWFAYKSIFYLIFHISFYWLLLPAILFYLLKKLKTVKGGEKSRLKYLIIGSICGWLGPVFLWPIEFRVDIYPYGNSFIAIFPLIFTYGILRYRLMNISIVIKKGLVYSTSVTVVTFAYLGLVIASGRLFQGIAGGNSFWINIISMILVALLFNPLRVRIQGVLDKHFFQGTLESLAHERQCLQQELFHKEKLAYVGQLASSVVHEIRNPLTTLETFIRYAPERMNDPEFKDKFRELMPKEMARIKKVVSNLLNLSKPASLNFMEINISYLIDETLYLLEEQIQLKDIIIEKQYSNDDILAVVDESQMKQVFLNLLLNSIQAMDEGGKLIIEVSQGEAINIIVSDSGCGMSQAQLADMFKPFQTTKDDGIGLGLVITQEIVKEHGGSINVESELNKGTKFIIILPQRSL